MVDPNTYFIDELKKNPEEYHHISAIALSHSNNYYDDEHLYLFLARYDGADIIICKWKEKWDFLISYLYLNR